MAKKQKPSPSQLAMSEVLQKEIETHDEVQVIEENSVKPNTSTRPRVVQQRRKRGRKYVQSAAKLGKRATMQTLEAIKTIQTAVYSAFPETMELHVNLLEPNIRGEVELPYSTGKKVRVAVADDTLIEKLEKGIVDFDVLVSTSTMMPKLTKYAKLLGPKGLMPNPKAGTLGPDTEELVRKFSGNVTRFKAESKSPIIHVIVGKTNDPAENLQANVDAYINAIGRKKIKNAYLCSTMSPSVSLIIQAN